MYILGLSFRKTLAFIVFFFFLKLFIYLYIFFNIVLTWKIVEASKVSVLYIYIYILKNLWYHIIALTNLIKGSKASLNIFNHMIAFINEPYS